MIQPSIFINNPNVFSCQRQTNGGKAVSQDQVTHKWLDHLTQLFLYSKLVLITLMLDATVRGGRVRCGNVFKYFQDVYFC